MTYSQMRVDRGIPRSSCEILILSIRNMLVRLRVSVLLREPVVYYIHNIGLLPQPYQEIIGLNVSMNVVFRVHELYSRDLFIVKFK